MSESRPSVLVTDAGFIPGLTVVRSLGRGGWRVVATHGQDRPRWSISRHADVWLTVPSAERAPARFAARIAAIAADQEIDLILATTDKSIYPIDANRAMFEPGSTLALPKPEALRTARDKDRTTRLAATLGIPTPRSQVADDAESTLRAADEIGWPVVVKPISSHAPDAGGAITTRSVFHARNVQELEAAIGSDRLGGFPVQVQQQVDGPGVGVELLVWQGETIASFQHRRLHEVPLSGGMSSYRVAERPDPILLDHSERILTALGWDGLAMVEFKQGREGPVLLEINGRVWGSIALPVRAGVDFPLLLAERYIGPGRLPPAANHLREGVACRNLELELRWLALASKARLGRRGATNRPPRFEIARTVAALARPSTEFDAQILEDWRPGLYDGMQSVTALIDAIASRRRQPS
ncbi:MAG: ATP-grasp domain-containing protein [Acidimicrobiales bacterium]